jgi:chaperonin GroES
MATSISPLGNRVVVEPAEQEQRTASGIVLPETAKEKPQRGKVLATWRARGDGRQGG